MNLIEEMAKELAKIPSGYVGITDPIEYQRRLKYCTQQAKQLLPILCKAINDIPIKSCEDETTDGYLYPDGQEYFRKTVLQLLETK